MCSHMVWGINLILMAHSELLCAVTKAILIKDVVKHMRNGALSCHGKGVHTLIAHEVSLFPK